MTAETFPSCLFSFSHFSSALFVVSHHAKKREMMQINMTLPFGLNTLPRMLTLIRQSVSTSRLYLALSPPHLISKMGSSTLDSKTLRTVLVIESKKANNDGSKPPCLLEPRSFSTSIHCCPQLDSCRVRYKPSLDGLWRSCNILRYKLGFFRTLFKVLSEHYTP